jgi:hypothetical protein
VGLTTTERKTTFHATMVAIGGTLSKMTCSDDGEDGEDEEDAEAEHG